MEQVLKHTTVTSVNQQCVGYGQSEAKELHNMPEQRLNRNVALKPLKVEKKPGTLHLKLVSLAKMHRILSFLWPHSLEFIGLSVMRWNTHFRLFYVHSLWTPFTDRKCVAVLYHCSITKNEIHMIIFSTNRLFERKPIWENVSNII